MAVSSGVMKSIVSASFVAMRQSGDNQTFADGIADGFIALAATAQISATMTGSDTSPAGTFSGNGTGSAGCMVVQSCAGDIKSACDAMQDGSKGDDYLAEEIAKAIDKVGKGATITISVSGQTVTTTSPPQTLPSSDSGTGKFNGDGGSGIETELKTCFVGMLNGSKKDDDFADALAKACSAYLTEGSVACQGSTHLAGASGNGTIS